MTNTNFVISKLKCVIFRGTVQIIFLIIAVKYYKNGRKSYGVNGVNISQFNLQNFQISQEKGDIDL